MNWKKLGIIFCPDRNYDWMQTHAANPVAEILDEHLIRTYFSCRDVHNRASIGFVEFDLREPQKILRISEDPVITPGKLGLFDDSGVSAGWIIRVGSRRFLYYLGWNLGATVPWRNSIGLAISETENAPFLKYTNAPVMDRSAEDPYSLSYPSVIRDGEIFRMLYGSNLSWGKEQKDMAHVLKYAESNDGLNWVRSGEVAIGFNYTDEYAMSKPSLLKENGLFKTWFSYRGPSYKIGYAESRDGRLWTRMDEKMNFACSDSGWDSASVEYPFVFDHKGTRYMLYNGNNYGRTGFGIAVQEQG